MDAFQLVPIDLGKIFFEYLSFDSEQD